jgi:hypothetical protein
MVIVNRRWCPTNAFKLYFHCSCRNFSWPLTPVTRHIWLAHGALRGWSGNCYLVCQNCHNNEVFYGSRQPEEEGTCRIFKFHQCQSSQIFGSLRKSGRGSARGLVKWSATRATTKNSQNPTDSRRRRSIHWRFKLIGEVAAVFIDSYPANSFG